MENIKIMYHLILCIIAIMLVVKFITLVKNNRNDKKTIQPFVHPMGRPGMEDPELKGKIGKNAKIFRLGDLKDVKSRNRGNKILLDYINQWLADNPNVTNVSFEFQSKDVGLRFRWEEINTIKLNFDVCEGNSPYRYAMTEIMKHGGSFMKPERSIDKWKQNNPSAKIVQSTGGFANTIEQTTNGGTIRRIVFQIVFLLRYEK